MHIAVHYPRPPGYIDVTQTIIVILTMVGIFLDRTHIPETFKSANIILSASGFENSQVMVCPCTMGL